MKKRSTIGGGPSKRNIQPVKEFEFSKPMVTPQLKQKKEEMDNANAKLEEAKNKFESWKADFQQKKLEIEDKQQKLAAQKANLREFTLHHNAELEKAKQKEAEEEQKMSKINEMIQELKKEDDLLKQRNDKLRADLDRLQPCADYLQRVVDVSSNYDSIESILNRYHSINKTREEYLTKYRQLLESFGTNSKKRNALIELRKSYLIDKTMRFNENIARMKQEKQQSEYKKMSLIKDIQRIEEKTIELSSIKTSIKSIYDRAMDRIIGNEQKNPGSDNLTEEQMLIAIKNRFSDLSEIIKASNVTILI